MQRILFASEQSAFETMLCPHSFCSCPSRTRHLGRRFSRTAHTVPQELFCWEIITTPDICVKEEPEDSQTSLTIRQASSSAQAVTVLEGRCFPPGVPSSVSSESNSGSHDQGASATSPLCTEENNGGNGTDSSPQESNHETDFLDASSELSFKCNLCPGTFIEEAHLRSHLEAHVRRPLVCDTCSASFSQLTAFVYHMRQHTQARQRKCPICSGEFDTQSLLENHIAVHAGEVCGNGQVRDAGLAQTTNRVRLQTTNKPHECKHCTASFAFAAQLSVHMLGHAGEKPHKCTMCPAAFYGHSQLTCHMRTHTGEKPFKCQLCPAEFVISAHLKSHMRTHTGEKPYKCEICPASYSQSVDLKRHMAKHTGEKPFKCAFCPAAFVRCLRLADHQRTHTGEKPYKCETCDATFSYTRQLKAHMETHTGQKPHRCRLCPAQFSQSTNLKRHMQVHTGEKPHKCEICLATFAQHSHLKRHVRIHGEERSSVTSEALC
ncbi:zinc finger protein 664-like [Ornithodoros turicata]|uniref:zinc finger protein 664-like n=1 Tax=Ornithodoros turicata TaxID=34597 RepID=UPI0031397311